MDSQSSLERPLFAVVLGGVLLLASVLPVWVQLAAVPLTTAGLGALVGTLFDLAREPPNERNSWREVGTAIGGGGGVYLAVALAIVYAL